MKKKIKLRLATIADAEMLLSWRNDFNTKNASHNTTEVTKETHMAWLEEVLSNSSRQLFIAEDNSNPVGTVRADYAKGVWELSWTTAPTARGKGVAKCMVSLLAKQIREPIRAEVRIGNIASLRIAESAGMKFVREVEGILHYSRGKIN